MAFKVFNSKEIHVRSFSQKGSLFQAAIKGLVIFLARGVRVSYRTPPEFNKVSPPSPVDVHTIYLISETMLNCVLAFYTSQYLLLFFLLVARRSCVASAAPPQRLVMRAVRSQQCQINGVDSMTTLWNIILDGCHLVSH